MVMTKLESTLSKQNIELKNKISSLQNQLDALAKLFAGKKNEKRNYVAAEQLGLFSLDATPSVEETETETVTVTTKTTKRKEKPVRKPLPDNLRREIIELKPKNIAKGAVRIGEEITEVLEVSIAEVYVKRYVRPKYALPNNGKVIIADLPKLPIYKSNAGVSMLTYLIISKYLDHLPWYRIIAIFERQGFTLSKSTVNNWFRLISEVLEPLYSLMVTQVKQSSYLQIDESTIPVRDSGKKGATHVGYFWVYYTPDDKIVIFDYQKGRAAKFPKEFLENFVGHIQTDGYAGYNFIAKNEQIIHIWCMAHARRKFIEAEENDAKRSKEMIEMFAQLYAIEKKARESNMTNDQRYILRQKESITILEQMKIWLDQNINQCTPDSKIGKAIKYTFGHWKELSGYVSHGKLEIDNNPIENKIRPLALGRKNYLFAGNHDAAQNAAMFYSLLATCKANNVNPQHYLLHAISQMTYCKSDQDRIKLLPQNFKGCTSQH